jgi:sigma-E factor negative regulatory protein RseA
LRGERGLDLDITARVMSALEQEPTVMAPMPRRSQGWQRPALALAASAAGVAVVGWLALAPGDGGFPVANGNLAGARQAQVVVAQTQSTPRLQEYLVAHQAYAPSGVIGGAARNIRTVAVAGEGK